MLQSQFKATILSKPVGQFHTVAPFLIMCPECIIIVTPTKIYVLPPTKAAFSFLELELAGLTFRHL